jgi:hypothetical protein
MRGAALASIVAAAAVACAAAPDPGMVARTAGTAVPAQAPCDAPEFGQLAFKVGGFDVTAANGQRAGESRVEPIVGGCALVEYWRGALGGEGRATYAYDRSAALWRMLFVSTTGELLSMSGRAEGTAVVFEGQNAYAGNVGLHRMTWSPLPGGGVRQFWQLSADGGRTWQQVFDGRYARRR